MLRFFLYPFYCLNETRKITSSIVHWWLNQLRTRHKMWWFIIVVVISSKFKYISFCTTSAHDSNDTPNTIQTYLISFSVSTISANQLLCLQQYLLAKESLTGVYTHIHTLNGTVQTEMRVRCGSTQKESMENNFAAEVHLLSFSVSLSVSHYIQHIIGSARTKRSKCIVWFAE